MKVYLTCFGPLFRHQHSTSTCIVAPSQNSGSFLFPFLHYIPIFHQVPISSIFKIYPESTILPSFHCYHPILSSCHLLFGCLPAYTPTPSTASTSCFPHNSWMIILTCQADHCSLLLKILEWLSTSLRIKF